MAGSGSSHSLIPRQIPSKEEGNECLACFYRFLDVVNLKCDHLSEGQKQDVEKTIQSAMFIVVNLQFLVEGYRRFTTKNDSDSLYDYYSQYEALRALNPRLDEGKWILRDFQATAIDLNDKLYFSGEIKPSLDQRIAIIKESLLGEAKRLEEAINTMLKRDDLLEAFAYCFEFNFNSGCARARTAKALDFAEDMSGEGPHQLNNLMQLVYVQCREADDQQKYQIAHKILSPYLNLSCVLSETEVTKIGPIDEERRHGKGRAEPRQSHDNSPKEVVLTPTLLDQYLQKISDITKPPETSDEEKSPGENDHLKKIQDFFQLNGEFKKEQLDELFQVYRLRDFKFILNVIVKKFSNQEISVQLVKINTADELVKLLDKNSKTCPVNLKHHLSYLLYAHAITTYEQLHTAKPEEEAYEIEQQQKAREVEKLIRSGFAIAKIIAQCWFDNHLKELIDYRYRAKLRTEIKKTEHDLYKLVHTAGPNENQIIKFKRGESRQKSRKPLYSYTKKTSATLIAEFTPDTTYTVLFTHQWPDHGENPLVGLIYNGRPEEMFVQVKAMILKDTCTYSREWVGTCDQVSGYEKKYGKVVEPIFNTFRNRIKTEVYSDESACRGKEIVRRPNEVLVKIKRKAVCAVVVGRENLKSYLRAFEYCNKLKYCCDLKDFEGKEKQLGIEVPIVKYIHRGEKEPILRAYSRTQFIDQIIKPKIFKENYDPDKEYLARRKLLMLEQFLMACKIILLADDPLRDEKISLIDDIKKEIEKAKNFDRDPKLNNGESWVKALDMINDHLMPKLDSNEVKQPNDKEQDIFSFKFFLFIMLDDESAILELRYQHKPRLIYNFLFKHGEGFYRSFKIGQSVLKHLYLKLLQPDNLIKFSRGEWHKIAQALENLGAPNFYTRYYFNLHVTDSLTYNIERIFLLAECLKVHAPESAEKWYKYAADAGHSLAQLRLAEIYHQGNNCGISSPNPVLAERYYLLVLNVPLKKLLQLCLLSLAESSLKEIVKQARYGLARLYCELGDEGGPRNPLKATELYRKIGDEANDCYLDAVSWLSETDFASFDYDRFFNVIQSTEKTPLIIKTTLYMVRAYLKQDNGESIALLLLGAIWKDSSAETKYLLNLCYKRYNREEDALEMHNLAVQERYPPALYERGVQTEDAIGITKAVKLYYEPAATSTNFDPDARAIYKMAECYRLGRGVTQDSEKAFAYYQKAADLGHLSSLYCLAECFFQGYGVNKNLDEALRYAQMAAENGSQIGNFLKGEIFSEKDNFDSAVESYELSIKDYHNNPPGYASRAITRIGIYYSKKEGHNFKTLTCYLYAALCGLEDAQNYLLNYFINFKLQKNLEANACAKFAVAIIKISGPTSFCKETKCLEKNEKIGKEKLIEVCRANPALTWQFFLALNENSYGYITINENLKNFIYHVQLHSECFLKLKSKEREALTSKLPDNKSKFYSNLNDDPAKLFALAKYCSRNNKNDEANLWYQEARKKIEEKGLVFYKHLKPDQMTSDEEKDFILFIGNVYMQMQNQKLNKDHYLIAALYFKQIADRSAEALYQLGKCYQAGDKGEDPKTCFFKALELDQNHAGAIYECGKIDDAQLGRSNNVRFQFWISASQKGQPIKETLFEAAECLRLQNNNRKAHDLYLRVAQMGHVEAMFRLGRSYEGKSARTYFSSPHLRNAAFWYGEAIQQGHVEACYFAAEIYRKHHGLFCPSSAKAFELYKQAADKNYYPARIIVVESYLQGSLLQQKDIAAAQLYAKTAIENTQDQIEKNKGHFLLGECYLDNKNYEMALEEYKKSISDCLASPTGSLPKFTTQAFTQMGFCAYQLRRYQESVACYLYAALEGDQNAQESIIRFITNKDLIDKNSQGTKINVYADIAIGLIKHLGAKKIAPETNIFKKDKAIAERILENSRAEALAFIGFIQSDDIFDKYFSLNKELNDFLKDKFITNTTTQCAATL